MSKFVNCFGSNPGEFSPVAYELKTLDEINDFFFDKNDEYVWRGQANILWPPYPTLYRRIKNSGYRDDRIFEPLVRQAERSVLDCAKAEGVIGSDDSVVEFMVRLQHYGGATRLLDVTTDYEVALYFASTQFPETVGTVLAYRINSERRVSLRGCSNGSLLAWDDLLNMARGGRPLLIEPEAYDRRIAVQSGAFLMTSLAGSLAEPNVFTHQTYDSEVIQILIPPALKAQLKAYLADRGITKEALFPSIERFSQENKVGSPIAGLER